MPWSTPAAISSGTARFTVDVPNNQEIRLALRGAVYNLYDPWRWLKEGSNLEPDEVTQAILERMGAIVFVVV